MHAWGGCILGKTTRSFLAVTGGVAASATAYAPFIGALGTASVDCTTASSVHSVNLLAAHMAESNLSGGLTSGSSAVNGASVQVVGQAKLDAAAADAVATATATATATAAAAAAAARELDKLHVVLLPPMQEEFLTQPGRNVSERPVSNLEVPDEPDEAF